MHITLLYVMDTIVLYVTPYTESVFIYVSPNTMQNQRAVLSRMLPVDQPRKRGTRERERERGRGRKKKLEKKSQRQMDRFIKRDGEKGGEQRDFFPFLLLLKLEGPKVSIFIWLCKDFLDEHVTREYRGRMTYRDTERIDSRRLFVLFYLFFRNESFSRRTLIPI